MYAIYCAVFLLGASTIIFPRVLHALILSAWRWMLDYASLLRAYWTSKPNPGDYHSKRMAEHRERLSVRADVQICSMSQYADRYRPVEVKDLDESLRMIQSCNGVVIIENGWMVFPHGEYLNIHHLTQQMHHQLINAYIALDEASSTITDYADTLGQEALSASDNKILRSISGQSAHYPLEQIIAPLALLLGVDPASNKLAAHGGDELWRRNSSRLAPKNSPSPV